jgi:hypothetical protein
MTNDNTPEQEKPLTEIATQMLGGSDKANPQNASEKGAGEIFSDILLGTPRTTNHQ